MVANFKRLMVTIHLAIEVTTHLATCQFDDTINHLADITGQLDESAPTNSVNSLKTSVNSLTTSVNSLTTSVNSLTTSVNTPTIIFVTPFGILVGQMKPLLLINILKISFVKGHLTYR